MKFSQAKYYLLAATLCLVGLTIAGHHYFFTGFSTVKETNYIYIGDDSTLDDVCRQLEPLAKPHAMTALRLLMQQSNYAQQMRTGRYAIQPDDGVLDVFRRLRNGQQTPLMVTIGEPRTMGRMAALLSQRLMMDSTALILALDNEEFCQQLGYDTCTIACIFIPNTYEMYWNTSIDRLMQRMKKEHDAFWNADRRQKAEALGLTPNEVQTLASIIDEETANQQEKPMVAGMYLNRLHTGMPLQADPTIKFAMQDFGLKRIYHQMLTIDSPYNTYKYTGLPPGPIKVASVKGIDAVLNAVSHDYLYMCAKEDFSGTHNFARTYGEHLRNAARYAKALNERGIK